MRNRYEKHHGVSYEREALEAAARLSERYITDRFLPDKAIDLLDEAGALIQIRSSSSSLSKLSSPSSSKKGKKSLVGPKKHRHPKNSGPWVTEDVVAEVVSEWTSVPVGKMINMDESKRLMDLEDGMGSRVVGQRRAVDAVARAVRRARSGLRDTNKPVASFLFCGPTGEILNLLLYQSFRFFLLFLPLFVTPISFHLLPLDKFKCFLCLSLNYF